MPPMKNFWKNTNSTITGMLPSTLMAIISVLSWITVYIGIGFIGLAVIGIWWLLDAFLIPGITTSANQELATRLAQ